MGYKVCFVVYEENGKSLKPEGYLNLMLYRDFAQHFKNKYENLLTAEKIEEVEEIGEKK